MTVKATPPKFTIPKKSKAVAGASPNAQDNEDRASRDRAEDDRPPMRSGLLVPAQLDQVMAQVVVGADAAAAETQRMRAQAALPQNLPGPLPMQLGPQHPVSSLQFSVPTMYPNPAQLGHAHAGAMHPATDPNHGTPYSLRLWRRVPVHPRASNIPLSLTINPGKRVKRGNKGGEASAAGQGDIRRTWGSRGRERQMQQPTERARHLASQPARSEPQTEVVGGC